MIDLRRMKAISKKRPRSASDFFSHVDNDGVRAISVLDITHYTWTVGLNAIFSLAGTLSPRLANRQPRENSLTPRGSPCNLALRSVRVPPNPHAGARASRAEPSALAKTNPGLRIKPPETDRTAAPASAAANGRPRIIRPPPATGPRSGRECRRSRSGCLLVAEPHLACRPRRSSNVPSQSSGGGLSRKLRQRHSMSFDGPSLGRSRRHFP